MKFKDLQHDDTVLIELGKRLVQRRIEMNLTQSELSQKAGVGKRTLERLEKGDSAQTRTLFRIFRELDLLGGFEVVLPEPSIRPRHAVKGKDELPKRAHKKKSIKGGHQEWKWGDER